MNDLQKTYKALLTKLKPYSKKLRVISNEKTRYELSGEKPFTVKSLKTGKTTQKENAYFAGVVMRKSFVGLQFMPPYSEKGFMDSFSKELNKRLKGKSCFHFKSADEVTSEVDRLIKKGYSTFKKKGLV